MEHLLKDACSATFPPSPLIGGHGCHRHASGSHDHVFINVFITARNAARDESSGPKEENGNDDENPCLAFQLPSHLRSRGRATLSDGAMTSTLVWVASLTSTPWVAFLTYRQCY